MNQAEQKVMDALVQAWNLYVLLPIEHPDDTQEFRHHFHQLQNQLLARPTRREILSNHGR